MDPPTLIHTAPRFPLCRPCPQYIERENGGVYPAFPRVTANDIYLGNGVSELIMMCMRALLNPGDEVAPLRDVTACHHATRGGTDFRRSPR